jgi:hypothetical protein
MTSEPRSLKGKSDELVPTEVEECCWGITYRLFEDMYECNDFAKLLNIECNNFAKLLTIESRRLGLKYWWQIDKLASRFYSRKNL